ncbi:MAG: NADPH-dependent FMN reductase [Parcubacteria bacterium C7867-008]|nr:MAG: NADPH-dependent FMN reductase [Parcubacteria bacterium C7867-008]
MPNYRLLAISGSQRKSSYNSALVQAFISAASENISIEVLDWSDVPLYNQDLEESFPTIVTEIKQKIAEVDGIIIATPEYNRSIPGPLKNLIDWVSRPYGQGAWAGKPVTVVGASVGSVGTALAHADVQKSLMFNNAHVLGQPEFYLGFAQNKFDEQGNLTDEDTKQHIISQLAAFTAYIDTLR